MQLTRVRRVLAVGIVLSLGMGLAACQTSSDRGGISGSEEKVELPALSTLTPLDDPRSFEGPTTAVIGGPSIPALPEAPKAELPVTVDSHDSGGDTEITVEDTSRIVPLSLSGSVGELVHSFGLAENIVGRDISTNFPGSEDIPIITKDGHSVDAEGVLSLNPSLIITDGSVGPVDVVLQLRDAGIPVVTVDRAKDPESSYLVAQQVADALGVGHAAPDVIAKLKQAITDKETEVEALLPKDPANRPRVAFLYVRGTAGIFYLFGEGSGVDSLIRSIGAIDVAEEVGWVGEKPMTEEALVAMNPDVILVMTKGLESAGGVDGLIQAQPSIGLTKAGEHRRIIDVDDTLLFAGGTRIPDVIDGLARAVYAPESLDSLD